MDFEKSLKRFADSAESVVLRMAHVNVRELYRNYLKVNTAS